MTVTKESKLWRQWKCDGSIAARNELLTRYYPMIAPKVESFVRRFGGDVDDLACAATDALMRAVDKFDPALSFDFGGYAASFITMGMRRVRFRRRRHTTVSLNVPVGGEDGTAELGEMVEDERAVQPVLSLGSIEATGMLMLPLSHWQRAMVRYHVLEGRDLTEIAVSLGWRADECSRRLHGALDTIASSFTADRLLEVVGVERVA